VRIAPVLAVVALGGGYALGGGGDGAATAPHSAPTRSSSVLGFAPRSAKVAAFLLDARSLRVREARFGHWRGVDLQPLGRLREITLG
jgi:hypothetical protein